MALLLILVFIVLPIAELYVIIQVGSWIGVLPTLALLLVSGFVGATLARSQGRVAWQRFNQALAEGRMPAREVFDGAAVVLGGALLLSPGFITDFFGVLLLLPPTRALFRASTRGAAKRTAPGRPVFFVYDRIGSRRPRAPGPDGSGPGPSGNTTPPRQPPGAGAPARPRRDYDFEGTAREVSESESSLPGRADDRAAGEDGSGNG